MKKMWMISLAVLSLAILACSKEGPQGLAGTNGTNGNANVTVKKIATPAFSASTYLGSSVNRFVINDADITRTLLDKGAVLFYIKVLGEWYQLPLIWQGNVPALADQFIVNTVDFGKISVYAWEKTTTVHPLTPSTDSCKYLLIFDKSVTGGRERSYEGLSYEEVCSRLGIEP